MTTVYDEFAVAAVVKSYFLQHMILRKQCLGCADLIEKIYIKILQATRRDQGIYTLTVNSFMFGKHNITFNIEVIEPATFENPMSIAVACLSTILILLVVSAVVFWKIRKKRESELKNSMQNCVVFFFLVYLINLLLVIKFINDIVISVLCENNDLQYLRLY